MQVCETMSSLAIWLRSDEAETLSKARDRPMQVDGWLGFAWVLVRYVLVCFSWLVYLLFLDGWLGFG